MFVGKGSDMRSKLPNMRRAFTLFAMLLLVPATVQAEPSLNGKSIRMVIGIGVGGGYDVWGRLVARHLGEHLPGNPTVIPENMPGGGSIVATDYIYNLAPKDGTVLGTITRDAILGPITGAKGVNFDPRKISWIGSPTTETNVCVAYNRPNVMVKTVDDLFRTQLIVGATGSGSGTQAYPTALGALLGMKFKIVSGFPSSSDIFLAMERGEVDGICESLDSIVGKRPDWISKGIVRVLFQGGAVPNPELKSVPFLLDLVKSQEEREAVLFLYAAQTLGRPFLAPPDMPPDRLKMLRDAFDATMKDPEFVSDVKSQKMDVLPVDGQKLNEFVHQIYLTPKAVVDRIADLTK
jgi:tripartite-type tricarboxylate transporter receptor subunit TctC